MVRTLSPARFHRRDPFFVHQARYGRVQCSGAEVDPSKNSDILHHGVAVFGTSRQTRKDQQFGIGCRTGCGLTRHTTNYDISQFELSCFKTGNTRANICSPGGNVMDEVRRLADHSFIAPCSDCLRRFEARAGSLAVGHILHTEYRVLASVAGGSGDSSIVILRSLPYSVPPLR